MKDATATMGQALGPETSIGTKDAVHVAVIAAIAAHSLGPASHVGIVNLDPLTVGNSDETVGIVDPYLDGVVYKGDRFWLFLYPRSITGLNHVWTHPAFDNVQTEYVKPADRIVSEQFLRDFARREGVSYEEVLEVATPEAVRNGYIGFGNENNKEEVTPDFWLHYKNVTGYDVPEKDRPEYFRCAC